MLTVKLVKGQGAIFEMSFPLQNAIKHNTEFEKCGGNYLEFQKNDNSLVKMCFKSS